MTKIVMVAFQRVHQDDGGVRADDGKPAMDEGRVRIEEEGAVDACDTSDDGADDGAADEAAGNDADSTEIHDAAAPLRHSSTDRRCHQGEDHDEGRDASG